MKYFTKDFHVLQWLIYAYSHVRKSKQAERFDEEFYRKSYDNACATFLRNERQTSWYVDPIKELHKVEAYANESNISDEERQFRITSLKAHIYANKDRIESGKFYRFDKELCKLKFAEQQRRNIEIYSRLPEEIRDKIADMRVFALGHASGEVKQLLKPYCVNLKRIYNQTALKAYGETNDTEKLLTRPIGLNDFEEIKISGIEKRGNNIYLAFDDCYLVFKNGEVTEGQCTPIYPFNYQKPNCPWSMVLNTELHFNENKLEVNFLISNFDELDRAHLWYLTIISTDITKFYTSKNEG